MPSSIGLSGNIANSLTLLRIAHHLPVPNDVRLRNIGIAKTPGSIVDNAHQGLEICNQSFSIIFEGRMPKRLGRLELVRSEKIFNQEKSAAVS